MAAIDAAWLDAGLRPLVARIPGHRHRHRHNWANRNPGVVLVFCIVFLVGLGIVALFAYRKWMARKAAKQAMEGDIDINIVIA
ncbi:hypothetical protein VTN02DRAFT_5342 [Thermoascus thermophilus]